MFNPKIIRIESEKTQHIANLLEIIICNFENFKVELSYNDIQSLELALTNAFNRSFSLIKFLLNNSITKKYKGLWSDSSSNYLQSIIKSAFKISNKKVVSFDHGNGSFIYNSLMKYFAVCPLSDEFVTYTNSAVNSYIDNFNKVTKNLKLNEKMKTRVISLNLDKTDKEYYRELKILFVGPTYFNNAVDLNFRSDNYDLEKFHFNLFKEINQKIIPLTLKPHPIYYLNKPRYNNLKGLVILADKFEKIYKDYNLFIFDNVSSTTFELAIMTSCPIIILDYHDLEFNTNVFTALEKRCTIISVDLASSHSHQIEYILSEIIISAKTYNKEYENHFISYLES